MDFAAGAEFRDVLVGFFPSEMQGSGKGFWNVALFPIL